MGTEMEKRCGIVMPISECDGRPASHWHDVLNIIEAAAKDADFNARLVSDTIESNLIHKEILQNIYQDEVIVCDVSGRNPNVFFELGIRMATQKPTVIIKDDKTAYPFDTAPNRYIDYPSDLRHPKMEVFRRKLTEMIKNVADHSSENSFIGQLGPFKVPEVGSTTISADEAILDRLERIERRITLVNETHGSSRIHKSMPRPTPSISSEIIGNDLSILVKGYDRNKLDNGIVDAVAAWEAPAKVAFKQRISNDTFNIVFTGEGVTSKEFLKLVLQSIDDAIPF